MAKLESREENLFNEKPHPEKDYDLSKHGDNNAETPITQKLVFPSFNSSTPESDRSLISESDQESAKPQLGGP